ncbi:hypothetical protein D3C86_1571300 [compost metagenome]
MYCYIPHWLVLVVLPHQHTETVDVGQVVIVLLDVLLKLLLFRFNVGDGFMQFLTALFS